MTTTTVPSELLLHIHQEVHIAAPPRVAFEALLEQLGPANDTPDGQPLALRLEAWPGGRWFRDLGGNAGHLWGHVQVIKPPTLLEICGPMFMSYAAMNHVQYRLTEARGGTLLALTHRAFGEIAPDHRTGVSMGWGHMMKRIVERAMRRG